MVADLVPIRDRRIEQRRVTAVDPPGNAL